MEVKNLKFNRKVGSSLSCQALGLWRLHQSHFNCSVTIHPRNLDTTDKAGKLIKSEFGILDRTELLIVRYIILQSPKVKLHRAVISSELKSRRIFRDISSWCQL